jgi:NADH:ubiquinone oxidoreductase subunit E
MKLKYKKITIPSLKLKLDRGYSFLSLHHIVNLMNHRREIVICLGSSCFARGNKNLLKIIQRYIVQHGLAEKVLFKGDHCFGDCNIGPNIKIGGKVFNGVTEENVHHILSEELQDLLK